MYTLCIFLDYTLNSHMLCGDALYKIYEKFRVDVLREAEWASWHYKLIRAAPYTCGWSVRKDKLEDLKNALRHYAIPFEEKNTITPTVDVTTQKPKDQHTCKDMICAAIKDISGAHGGNRNGVSRYAIKKYILAMYTNRPYLKVLNNTLKKMVVSGELVKTSERFKIAKVAKKTGSGTKKPSKIKKVSAAIEKAIMDTPYTELWNLWETSSPLRMVSGECANGSMKIHIEKEGKEETFAVLFEGDEDDEGKYDEEHDEAYEEVAKIAWEQSKLKD